MFDSGVPLVDPSSKFVSSGDAAPLLLWAIWRLDYDDRGWKLQTLIAWLVVPINHFWAASVRSELGAGPFSHEQHVVPGLIYLAVYLVVCRLLGLLAHTPPRFASGGRQEEGRLAIRSGPAIDCRHALCAASSKASGTDGFLR